MKLRIIILSSISLVALMFTSCNSEGKVSVEENVDPEQTVAQTEEGIPEKNSSEAYLLMEQKCFICHIGKPDPSRKASMLAPPMMRVQAHYKPSFSDRESFVKAVSNFVLNPTEEAALMPGAIRKFNLMTNLNYDKQEVEKIAALLFDMDFGDFPNRHKQGKMRADTMKLSLNHGQKWKIKPEAIIKVNDLLLELEDFKSNKVEDYNQLGKEIFDLAKYFLLDKDYNDEELMQLKYFFHDTEPKIHALVSTNDVSEAQNLMVELKLRFENFKNFFE